MDFVTFLKKKEVPDFFVSLAKRCVLDRRPLDITVMHRLNLAYKEYCDYDTSTARTVQIMNAQGYDAINQGNVVIYTVLNGDPAEIHTTACGVKQRENERVITFGSWNVHMKYGVEYYPFFVIGVIDWINRNKVFGLQTY